MCCFTTVRSTFTRVQSANVRTASATVRFYVGHSHFEASQCPQVIGSAQDGERAAGAETIYGQDPGSRPMSRSVENALKSENLKKSNKKRFENYEIL